MPRKTSVLIYDVAALIHDCRGMFNRSQRLAGDSNMSFRELISLSAIGMCIAFSALAQDARKNKPA